jgi:DNA-binding transcriptional ArsR family regulator
MHVHAMNDRLRNLHSLMAALGHSSRFRLTLSLLEGERCVGELARAIGLSQSCTTRHVQALERAGIVRSRRDGKRVLVGIESDREEIAQLLEWLAPAADAERAEGGPPPRPAAARAGRRGPGPRASARRAGAGADPGAPRVESEEPAPLAAPASGTHAPPVQEPTPHPRRPHETLEDFLL